MKNVKVKEVRLTSDKRDIDLCVEENFSGSMRNRHQGTNM